jgi:hypothetical protein
MEGGAERGDVAGGQFLVGSRGEGLAARPHRLAPAAGTDFARDLAVLAGFAAVSVLAASATLRRRTR